LIEPTGGEVRLEGQVVARSNQARLRARVGFLTEAPGLWDRLTVRENLLTYARLHGLESPERAVDQSLEAFGMSDRAAEPAAQLSKGLKQRVAVARTLLHNPDIILLDEPTAGLDPESARELRDLIVNLRDGARAVVLSTHNLDEVDRIATRVAVMRQRLLAVDTPESLRGRLFGHRLRVVLTGHAGEYIPALRAEGHPDVVADDNTLSIATRDTLRDTPDVVRLLVRHGAEIVSVVPEERSLEDVYLRLVHEGAPA
jgi:ABC-2 type transport system ATP-binding protein